jgi:DNA primase
LARIPDSVIDEVRTRADIVAVIGRYVTLRKAGRQFQGLCPFHDEKTPSFQVSPDKQVFYCFGCQTSGNVISFLMKHNGLEFPEAVGVLARELGVAIPERGEGEGRSAALYHANDAALEYFRASLRGSEGAPARAHLARRGIPEDLIERFQIGYAPARWDGLISHLRGDKALREASLGAGLLKRRETGDGFYDAFRDRVIFPIAEPGGRLLGFGGRALSEDGGPKYINSAESAVYHKSRVLFGLPLAVDAIRKAGRTIVVEGYFDVLGLHRAGLAEAVAPCGTALTEEHARRLHRYAPEVVLLFDGDAAGQRAAERCLPLLLAEGLRVRAAFLPAGEDPDSLVQKSGAPALRAIVDAAEPLLDHLIERAVKGAVDHAWQAADVTRQLAPFVRAIPDAVERAAYQRRLASYLQLPADALAASIGDPESVPASVVPVPAAAAARRKLRPEELDPVVVTLLAAALAFEGAARHLERVESDWIPEGINRELYATLSQAISAHGHAAAAHLLSPENAEAAPEIAELVGRLTAREQGDARSAEQAALDCVQRLQRRALEARNRALEAQLEKCTDRERENALLEEKQRLLALRKALGAGIAQT